VTAMPDESLRFAPVIDYVGHKEFDLAIVAIAEGRRYADVKGISYRENGAVVHNGTRRRSPRSSSTPCPSSPRSTSATSTT